MKVLHVVQNLKRSGGGPSRSSQGLVAGLCAAGIDAWMLILAHGEDPWVSGVKNYINGGRIEDALLYVRPDIVHLHGIWGLDLHHCARICRRYNIPYVIAPRGMLEPWSLKTKWLKKRIARFLYQDTDLHHAAALHATAESEAAQFRELGFRNYCIISPNGVNTPFRRLEKQVKKVNEVRRALYVSRMHAKKGVLELVESWGRVKPSGWVCELVYTLNGEAEKSYEEMVKRRVRELGLVEDIIFTGPLDDEKKWEAYGRADLFVLPTYSENFGIVVAEALWAGVPVITTTGTPWQELVSSQCGWLIDLPPKESLDVALRAAMSTFNLQRMGEMGHRLIESKYTWKAVCKAMCQGYEHVLGVATT